MATPDHAVQRAPRRKRTLADWVQPIVFIVFAVSLPTIHNALGTTGDSWLPLTTLSFCAIFAVFGVGLNIVVGYAGLLDLGYVAFFAIGAYAGGWFMSDFVPVSRFDFFGGSQNVKIPGIHLNFWLVVIIAVILCAAAGIVIGAPTLRLKSDYLALVTLGFGEIIGQVATNGGAIAGHNITNGSVGIGPVDEANLQPFDLIPGVPTLVGTFDNDVRYYVIIAMLAVFMFVSLRLRDGKLGRAWLAVREDELAASLMGVPLMRTKLWAYAVGAAAGGIGGAFSVITFGSIDPSQFNFQVSVIILVIVIVGGMGNVYGVVLAAFILEWLNYTGMGQIGGAIGFDNLPNWEFLIFGLILVLMMLFRPDGLLPAARQKQVRAVEAQLETLGTEGTA